MAEDSVNYKRKYLDLKERIRNYIKFIVDAREELYNDYINDMDGLLEKAADNYGECMEHAKSFLPEVADLLPEEE